MNRYQIITLITIAFVALIFLSIYQGWFIQLKGDKYGREYNRERLEQNQPIIEEYFVKEPLTKERSNSWVDKTKSHEHLEKFYYTNLIGDLMYEIDSYRPPVESTWLAECLNVSKSEQLDIDSWKLNRIFYPNKSSVSYDVLFRLKDGPYRTIMIDPALGDSLLQSLN